ncbi:hypothetical protein G3A43_06580 [Paraburkholderia aspalathi]|nr:hypothetical protein [Paraburkholderia aspalathi]MBK3779915.1 hypothetical protein [Paraburkholderia aspalathi]
MRKPKAPRIYTTLRRQFTTEALHHLGFVHDGTRMVKRGACRKELATASSLDQVWWRVTPLVRQWR